MDPKIEYIAAAAVYVDDNIVHEFQSVYGVKTGLVYGGFRHPYIKETIPEHYLKEYKVIDGFITSYGRFVNRQDAIPIAAAAHQIDVNEIHNNELTSEDIFKVQYNFISYDNI